MVMVRIVRIRVRVRVRVGTEKAPVIRVNWLLHLTRCRREAATICHRPL